MKAFHNLALSSHTAGLRYLQGKGKRGAVRDRLAQPVVGPGKCLLDQRSHAKRRQERHRAGEQADVQQLCTAANPSGHDDRGGNRGRQDHEIGQVLSQ